MRKKIKRLLSIFFIFFLVNSFFYYRDAFSDNRKNFLWKVQSGAGTVYILGSIHFMKKEFYPLDRKIEESFDKSDILVVEADINDISKMNIQKLMESAFYSDDDTLEKHISKETYELVKKEFEGLGIPLWIVNKQRPWFLALTLTSFELMKSGYDPTYGMDVHFLSEASGKKKIEELESVDYQINLLSSFSDSDQEAFLLYTLKDAKSLEKEVDSLIRAWKSGDTESMESAMMDKIRDDEKLSSIYEKILYERNRNMVSKIEGFLKTDKTYFIIVGAGHLVGKKGIIEMLKAKGYNIEQL